jgi:hypothetical protein
MALRSSYVCVGLALLSLLTASSVHAQISPLGASFGITAMPVRGSAVAYDSKNHVYLTVGVYGVVKGRFVAANGTMPNEPFQINTAGGFAHYPSVAYSPDADEGRGAFLVVWHESTGGPNYVRARLVSYTSGLIGEELALANGEATWWEAAPQVEYSTTSKVFLVVWQILGAQIRAARVSHTGQALGYLAVTTGAPDFARDPSVAYNPTTDAFLVAYSGYNNSAALVTARLVSGAGVMSPQQLLSMGTGTYVTEASFSTGSGKYLVSWYQLPGGPMGRLVDATGTPAGSAVPLSTRFGTYDSLGLAYNRLSGTYLMVGQDMLSAENGAVEISEGGVPGSSGGVTFLGGSVGNFYPQVAASTAHTRWLLTTAHDFRAVAGQFVQTAGTGGLPPPAPASMTSLTMTPGSVVPPGSAVSMTATAAGGTGPLQYKFWRYSYTLRNWTVAQDWSTSNHLTWTPGTFDGGWHKVQAWVRSAGATGDPDDWDEQTFRVQTPIPRLLSLRASSSTGGTGAMPPNSRVTVTALAVGGLSGLVEYQFWRYNSGTARWFVDRPWSSNDSYTWLPAASDEGVHNLQVWVREPGQSAWQDWTSIELLVSQISVASVTPQTATVADGSPLTFTAQGSGNPAGYEYKFWRYHVPTGTWAVIRDYRTSNTFQWVPTSRDQGGNFIQVWVRSAGSAAAYAAWMQTQTITVTPPR